MIQINLEDISSLAKQALAKPSDFGYWGNQDMFKTWGFSGHDVTRDSSVMEKSNFKVITEDLISRFPNDFVIEQYNHWLCGWIDRLTCHILIDDDEDCVEDNITESFKEAVIWHEKLQDYPIADEDDYYEQLHNEAIEAITDMADYLLLVTDRTKDGWAEKILYTLENEMGFEFNPDYDQYPDDDQVLEAILKSDLCNPETWGEWNEWCDEHNFDRPIWPVIENPNQLKLFED